MANQWHSKASSVLDHLTAPLNNGVEHLKQGFENMEKNHKELDELIEKDDKKMDEMLKEVDEEYGKISPKNGNITLEELKSFYMKDRKMIIEMYKEIDELKAKKNQTDCLGRAKIDGAILGIGARGIKSTVKLVKTVSSLRNHLQKESDDLIKEIDDAKAKGDLTDEQKQQFENKSKELVKRIRDDREYMTKNMTPSVKVLQILFKQTMQKYEKLANDTEEKTKER